METTEQWMDIPGLDGFKASTHGRIKSRMGIVGEGGRDKNGYRRITAKIDGKKMTLKVHQLVALTFHGPCPPGLQTRHWDGDPDNCRPENLIYGTGSENQQDKIRHGRNWALNKKFCPWDHLLEKPNLCRGEWRKCLACSRANALISYERRSGKVVSDKQTLSDRYYSDIMSERGCPCPQPEEQVERVKLHI